MMAIKILGRHRDQAGTVGQAPLAGRRRRSVAQLDRIKVMAADRPARPVFVLTNRASGIRGSAA
jgi:hypothetical protein